MLERKEGRVAGRMGGYGEQGLKGVQWLTNVQGACGTAQAGIRVDGGDRKRGVPRLGRGLCANDVDVGVGAAVMSGHVGCDMELRHLKCLGQRSVGRLCGVSPVCFHR